VKTSQLKLRISRTQGGLDYQESLGLILGEEDKSVTFTSATIYNFKKLGIMLLYTKN
jgi:hypothetical protein